MFLNTEKHKNPLNLQETGQFEEGKKKKKKKAVAGRQMKSQ